MNEAFANEKPATIKQMQEDIDASEKENEAYQNHTQNFLVGSMMLRDFLRGDLSGEEEILLESILGEYLSNIQKIVLSGSLDYKNEILTLQQKFYIRILPFIEISKIELFTSEVEQDAFAFEKNGVLSYTGNDEYLKKETRVLELQHQAQKNTELIRIQMQDKILGQIQKKIDIIVDQEKFQSLPAPIKKEVFQKLSDKLALKLQELQTTLNPTGIIEEKIFLYHGILELLQHYIDQWK